LVKKALITKIRNDFRFLINDSRVLALLLFGSYLDETLITSRSDLDICIVAPFTKKPEKLLSDVFSRIRSSKYDIKIFELLPLYLKIEIIENHLVIFAKDLPELYEYFYFYRKLWKDQAYRNRVSRDDILRILKRHHPTKRN